MTAADLAGVARVAAIVHPDYPEDDAVFSERLALFPAGCFVLAEGTRVAGYVIGHPGRLGAPPALNTLLGNLPDAPDTFYIHDLALLPEMRGGGHAAEIVARLAETAGRQGLPTLSLIAIRGAGGFWERQGFAVEDVPALRGKLAAYDDEARLMIRRLACGQGV